jgi:uncharacterized membrane protein HdeD (DUF308 family)
MAVPGGTAAGGTGTGVFPGSRLPGPGRTWQAVAVAAGLTIVVGLVLLIWPKATVVVVAVLIGVALLVTGILRLLQGITASDESGAMRVAYVIIGILAGLAGLYCLRHISVTVALLAFIVGVFWALHGVADILVAVTAPAGSGRGVIALAGILSLAAGLIVMFWPAISVTILVVVLGIWLLCYGVLLAFLAFQLRAVLKTAAG